MGETADRDTSTPGESEPRWLDAVEMRAWLAFWGATHLVDAAIDRDLQEHSGLSHGEYQILAMLSAAPAWRLRMSTLAEIVFVSRSRLTYQVTQLENAGLVRREDYPGDKRGAVCVLTEQGMDVLRTAAPGHVAGVRRVFFDVLTPEQIAVLGDALTTVRDHLLQEADSGNARAFLAAFQAGTQDQARPNHR